ncbi:MAG TPA: hypothetical protein VFQ00_02555 [Terriglobales bacterium]|nr:hypothetical protein [Terriglobales bacterium]
MTNAQIAELLAREAVSAKMPAAKALRRASRRALFWAEEVAELHRQGRSLTELTAIGPYLAKLIAGWIEKPPQLPEPPDLRRGFLTLTEARFILASAPRVKVANQKTPPIERHDEWNTRSYSSTRQRKSGTRESSPAEENRGWLGRIRGDLQMHSTWSDGEGTIAENGGCGDCSWL